MYVHQTAGDRNENNLNPRQISVLCSLLLKTNPLSSAPAPVLQPCEALESPVSHTYGHPDADV